ncbi:hypothetical protein FRB95_002373 [Tulasnella sp. JGI-2019a]|nr:hypothetical protein FRB95_002373 [Tulasnella sp. JGI-2019a]
MGRQVVDQWPSITTPYGTDAQFSSQAASERYAGIANGKLPMANMSEAKVWTRGWRRKNNNDNLEQKQPPDWQQPSMRFEPVRPLAPVNSCTGFGNQKPRYRCQLTKQDKEALMNRKVTSLLNKLTTKTFDSISDEIIEWANKSERETDEKTLIDFLRLIFDKAIDESRWSEMYAKLCEKMVEQVSLDASDRGLRSRQWRSMAGKQLLRKFIRDRCQEALERSWSTMEVAIASAASKKEEDDAKAANAAAVAKARCQEERVSLYSEEYYAALKAKRRAADLITFVGELFKLSIITERIVHECIEKLLKEIELLREEHQIKSLCTLLAMVGQMLDTQKNKNQIDVYFKRMAAVAVKPGVGSMMQYMLQDVIDLRGRNWITIRAFNEQAANERTAGLANGKLPMGSGGAGRDERITIGSEGINGTSPGGKPLDPASTTVCAPPAKAGDISQFGKTIKSGDIISMCPSSVFKKGGRPTNGHGDNGLGVNGPRGEDASGPAVGRRPVATGSNMFSLLSDTGSIESGSRQTNMNTKREPMAPKVDVSVTLSPSSTAGLIGAPSSMSKRKKIKLLPKNPPVPAHTWPPVATPRQVEAPNIALEE